MVKPDLFFRVDGSSAIGLGHLIRSLALAQMIDSLFNIHFYGFQKDIRPFIKLSDALVFPSYREGFPNVPMQAAAMGLPQIVSDINGCNEIVISGVTGLIVPPKNSHALFDAMIELSNNHDLRNQMAINSRPIIVNCYSRQNILKSIENEYNNLFINLNK